MKHLAWLALAAGLALLAARGAPATAATQDATLVHMSSDVTYDLRLDRGPIFVTWNVTLQNNDPDTTFNDSGVSYYYARWAVPVLRGASVSATGPDGAPLSVGIVDTTTGPVVGAEVTFESGLFYGDSYSFTLTYSLGDTRTEALLITPFYAYIPAFGAGDTSTVRVLTPDDTAWDADVQPVDCDAGADDEFHCSSAAGLPLAAFVEVSRPDSLRSETGEAPLSPGPVALTVRYFPGEEAWAIHVLEVSEAALPVLEELFGRPYNLEPSIEITEQGQLDLLGYEGLFACVSDPCSVGVSPLTDDLTLLHELAHAWTANIEKRWLAEGLAEFMARKAAGRLGALISYREREAPPDAAVFPLDEWERSLLGLDATEQQRARELSGYERSLQFMQLIERTYGLDAIQQANAGVNQMRGVDSKQYFDALEEATQANLDKLFLEWVFPASFETTLNERREVRNQLLLLQKASEDAGLTLPSDIEALVDNWSFDSARDELDEAGEALAAYNEARSDVDETRNLLQRVGLIGEDPDEAIEDAANAYKAGRFHETLKQAGDAQDTIDGAATTGVLRLLLAIGIPLLVAAIVLFLLRRRRRRRQTDVPI